MQEEVENRTVNLMISTTKLTGRALIAGYRKFQQYRVRAKSEKGIPRGKQTVKKLIRQNQGVSSIDIANTGIRDFDRVVKKYGVDYAIKKDRSAAPPRYLIFFKARDADALTAAFKEYSAKQMSRSQKPSVLKQLSRFKELAAAIPAKVRQKKLERDL